MGPIGLDGAAGDIGVDAVDAIARDAGTPDLMIPIGTEACGPTTTYRTETLPFEMLLVVDRAVDQATWNELRSALADLMNAVDWDYRWGLKLFPEDGSACGTVTDKLDVPFADMNASQVIAALDATTPTTGNGRPTAAALTAARAYLASVADQNPKFMMLVTGGAPTCAGAAGTLTSDPAQAQADAIAAITPGAAGNYTFVLGAGVTGAADVEAVNILADAGGVPRQAQSIRFYRPSDAHELSLVLTPVWDRSCTFRMPEPPPGAVDIVVKLNGVQVPHDETHQYGWAYANASHTAFTFYGDACNQIASTREPEVQISFLCLLL
jgi:hypothetical protein